MASSIYLKGGPCDGKTVSADQIHGGLVAYIACGGGFYTDAGTQRPDGDEIFSYAGKTAPGPPGDDGTPHTHSGWQSLRKTVNHHGPKALHDAHNTTNAALRNLARARKVRL